MVFAIVRAYANKGDLQSVVKRSRVGLSASLVRRIVVNGLQSYIADEVGSCATVLFAFFQCPAVSVVYYNCYDRYCTGRAPRISPDYSTEMCTDTVDT